MPDYYTNMQVDRDAEHLRILSICWYILSGLAAFFGLVPIIHVIIGITLITQSRGGAGDPPAFVGWMFMCMGSFFILFIETVAVLGFFTARSLKERRRRTLCFIAAGMCCLQIPIGLTLAVFTFIVLSRPSIKASFT